MPAKKRPHPVRSERSPSWQVAAGYRDINTAKTVVGPLQKWPAKAGGRSLKGPAMAGTTVPQSASIYSAANEYQHSWEGTCDGLASCPGESVQLHSNCLH